MKIFVFGSSLTSSHWNSAAPYFRGIYKSLAELGFQITFAQPDTFPWRQHRDHGDYSYAEISDYDLPYDLPALFQRACQADLVIRHSGIGDDDALLERCVLDCKSASTQVAFWEVDTPARSSFDDGGSHSLWWTIPRYDYVFTNGGGARAIEHLEKLGARNCHSICNALDAPLHYPVARDPESACDLLFIGDRESGRQRKVEEFLFAAAGQAPQFSFALGGEGWEDTPLPENVRALGPVDACDLNRLNCSARMVLHLSNEPMVLAGLSPSRSIFEAAGAGACVITDPWEGIESFFEPGCEILVARNAGEIVDLLRTVDARLAAEIGEAMRMRAYTEHTYASRALHIREILKQPAPDLRSWQSPIRQTA